MCCLSSSGVHVDVELARKKPFGYLLMFFSIGLRWLYAMPIPFQPDPHILYPSPLLSKSQHIIQQKETKRTTNHSQISSSLLIHPLLPEFHPLPLHLPPPPPSKVTLTPHPSGTGTLYTRHKSLIPSHTLGNSLVVLQAFKIQGRASKEILSKCWQEHA